jgi:hypothetical protein
MFCPAGEALWNQFEIETERRAVAKDDAVRTNEYCDRSAERLSSAKQNYGDAFVAWVTHRSCCVDSRVSSCSHDITQFASM